MSVSPARHVRSNVHCESGLRGHLWKIPDPTMGPKTTVWVLHPDSRLVPWFLPSKSGPHLFFSQQTSVDFIVLTTPRVWADIPLVGRKLVEGGPSSMALQNCPLILSYTGFYRRTPTSGRMDRKTLYCLHSFLSTPVKHTHRSCFWAGISLIMAPDSLA